MGHGNGVNIEGYGDWRRRIPTAWRLLKICYKKSETCFLLVLSSARQHFDWEGVPCPLRPWPFVTFFSYLDSGQQNHCP